MTSEEASLKISCPYCGWSHTVPLSVIEGNSLTFSTRGIDEIIKFMAEKIRSVLADKSVDNANAWIDMPPCQYCKNVYQYNLRTQETKK